MLVDVSSGKEEKVKRLRESSEYRTMDFGKEYYKRVCEMNNILEAAKIYILDNYRKIGFWGDIHFMLYGYAESKTCIYFGMKNIERNMREPGKPRKKPRKGRRVLSSVKSSPTLIEMLREMEMDKIQIRCIDEVIYDWIDGDFSISINGIWYSCINHRNPEAIIEIAYYIEKKLKKE